ncbi:RDD family protein [Peterkaempfera bronchialis]|uniref:RDD family protein n=1 Tax=Peterkaempfera bronchialis TaxID=2126346 RepID=A0A345SW47_9ACTN|nr:RDD family protein [Peterkaempfera bronchialis]AXI77952.1 RDD family protein [Peterkaempfera bronchialis]
MSYPPGPDNPYGQQPPQQPGYGYPQQPPGQPGKPGYGVPPQPSYDGAAYGYPQQQYPPSGYGYGQAYGYDNRPPYAGWGARVGSFLINGLISGVPMMICYFIGGAMLITDVSRHCTTDSNGSVDCSAAGDSFSGVGLAVVILGGVVSLAISLWLIYQDGTTGQSVGRKVCNVRLVRESDGQPVGFGMAFARYLCHFVDGVPCYIGYLWPIWDDKKQTFADKITNTVVVRTR